MTSRHYVKFSALTKRFVARVAQVFLKSRLTLKCLVEEPISLEFLHLKWYLHASFSSFTLGSIFRLDCGRLLNITAWSKLRNATCMTKSAFRAEWTWTQWNHVWCFGSVCENGAKMMYKRIMGSFRPRPRYPRPADTVNFFVPQLLFLYWDLYFCTGIHIVVLLYTWILLYRGI